jgi:hypothetical protein
MLKCDTNYTSLGSNSDLDRFCHSALLRNPRPANACVGYHRLPAAHLFESAIRDAQAAMHIVILRSIHPYTFSLWVAQGTSSVRCNLSNLP